jgi:chorismate dehydratase
MVRLGSVSFLNARPLVWGLDAHGDRFNVRFDLPSRCASLLHAGDIDVGLIPSIEYVAGDYAIVPGVGIVSEGEVASVALFARGPVESVRSIALDTSSRTSVALTRVLCARHFGIQPTYVHAAPDLDRMLAQADAALVIGDPALFVDTEARGLNKVDLGAAWTAMTGLPFVYAFWAGRPGAMSGEDVALLQAARDAGVREHAAIAREFFPSDPEKQAIAERYLRTNIRHDVGTREQEALALFFNLAASAGAAPAVRSLRWFDPSLRALSSR